MTLEETLAGLTDAKNKLRSATAVVNPVVMSEQMMRLSVYASSLDDYRADTEEEYEIELRGKMKEYIDDGIKVSPAEIKAKIDLAKTRGLMSKLDILSGSAWKQIATIQSRINHLNRESGTNI